MNSQIKVLSKFDRSRPDATLMGAPVDCLESNQGVGCTRFKHGSEANTFKLIDDKDWNIVSAEPSSETTFFTDGHSAMSVISVIGSKGVGKSSLLNKIAGKEAFVTYRTSSSPNRLSIKHITRGIDIHATHHRMLLDCQPLLAPSVLEDFLSGYSNSQFPKNSPISDPTISCHMMSLQLATFLIASSDYVIIMCKWLIDVNFLKLISSAIMMIGEDNLRAKFIIFSEDKTIHEKKLKVIIDKCLGRNKVVKVFDKESELLDYIIPYSNEKCVICQVDSTTFTGKNWLSSCQRLWNTTIKNSSMFSDYATQLVNTN